ncbi:hypothetical protein [Flavobacterium mesophilum]|uniref:hypothetical protein n=1 Tax=Flavobacterium mesophilum TaxID=3143495 RepID=UPI0031DF95E4
MKVPSSFVVETKFNNHYDIYPPDCYLIFQNKKHLIKEIYKYKRGILNEYWFLGSEGFAVEKLGMNGNKYSKEQECFKFLNLEKAKDYLAFNSVKYKIDYIKGDTSISKIDTNDIVIFIDEK